MSDHVSTDIPDTFKKLDPLLPDQHGSGDLTFKNWLLLSSRELDFTQRDEKWFAAPKHRTYIIYILVLSYLVSH